jgi:hypothetical protein
MVYVVAACADQAEEINRILAKDGKKQPYHLFEVLPGGEGSLNDPTLVKKFADGTEKSLLGHIGVGSVVLTTIQKVAWNKKTDIFGPVVCSVLHQNLFFRIKASLLVF